MGGWVHDGVGGVDHWKVHGGPWEGWLEGSWGEWVCGGVGGGGLGGWRVHVVGRW